MLKNLKKKFEDNPTPVVLWSLGAAGLSTTFLVLILKKDFKHLKEMEDLHTEFLRAIEKKGHFDIADSVNGKIYRFKELKK